ncbi:MAG: hypothetical protein IIA45_05710, partial [Bacteroidetes bacterium]|nr:hypothetical protein [Bacteroidota bacterium]
ISDLITFSAASNHLKVHIANKLILESSPRVGGLAESGDVSWFLYNFAQEFHGTGLFGGRRYQPLKAALLLAAMSPPVASPLTLTSTDFEHIVGGGGALAALYLFSQLEYVIRVKSRYLDDEGEVIKKFPEQLSRKLGLIGQKKMATDW